MEELETSSLATQHSLLLEERLRGAVHGPTSFSGLFGSTSSRVNEYATFLAPDEDAERGERARPLQRWVSNIGRILPAGVQIEPRKLEIEMPPPARRTAAGAQPAPQARTQRPAQQQPGQQQQAELPAAKHPRLSGRFAGSGAPPEQPAPPPQPIAQAAPVPGNPLKIRLKFTRGSSMPRGSPSKAISAEAAAALVQSARQLGAGLHPPLSPIPAGWAEVVSCVTPAPAAAPCAVALGSGGGSGGSGIPSPFESVSAEEYGQLATGAPAAAVAPAVTGGPVPEPARQLPQQAGLQEQALPGSGLGVRAGEQQREQQLAQPPQQQEQQQEVQPRQEHHPRRPSPPAIMAGAKRPAPPLQPSDAAAQAPNHAAKRQKAPAAAGAPDTAKPAVLDTPAVLPGGSAVPSAGPADSSHLLARPPSTGAGLAGESTQQQQQPAAPVPKRGQQERSTLLPGEQRLAAGQHLPQQAVPQWAAEALAGRSDDSRLGVVAALLVPALQQAAGGELPGSRMVQSLQEEGKKLKKFAEKKRRDGRPTHVSSMFLCQSCVKFLTVAAIMEGHPAKYSRENTSSMYAQTASLLDSCAHNAGRAEGPATITAAIALLAQRLAAVARLRAAYCLRAEGAQQVTAFRAALEKASGETYQRPSPTDSNTSTSISVPLDPAGNAKPAGAAGSSAARSVTPTGGRGRAAPPPPAAAGHKAPPAPAEALVGLPKAVLERQLLAAQHSQATATALSAFAKSSERLREFMAQAAAQSDVQGLKVAAATLLLSADAGMGPAASVLAFAKDALDAVMQMQ